MSELEQLEQKILQLSPEDMAKFRAWFIELDHRLWGTKARHSSASDSR
jgi:hypothetical protein